MIEISSRVRNNRLKKQSDLESKIKILEVEHKNNNRNKNLLKELKQKSHELEEILTYKAEGALRYLNQKYYEKGNRASRLLAFQLRKEQANRVVSKVLHPISRNLVSQPREITEAFASVYEQLYDSPEIINKEEKIRTFFSGLKMPCLSQEEARNMTTQIEEQEIKEVIKKMKEQQVPRDGWDSRRVL